MTMSFAFHAVQLMYFMVPAYVANMAPLFVKYLRGLESPNQSAVARQP
jgi:hypothetical protein